MKTRIDNLKEVIEYLINENQKYSKIKMPDSFQEMKDLMRALMNVRQPGYVSDDFLEKQDRELQRQLEEKGIVTIDETKRSPIYPKLRLWKGDITRLQVDAIVNAANKALLGCFVPLHRCIDNAIHSAAGLQLRNECDRIMDAQGDYEKTGTAKITRGYNLPAKYVLHTVGPIVQNHLPNMKQEMELADCYKSCLELSSERGLKSMAFCCISTGEFGFPQKRASEIAVATVSVFLDNNKTSLDDIVFNVFTDRDYELYHKILWGEQ